MADEFYGPRSRANARALLKAAESLGLPPTAVRTQAGGYLVPHEVAEIVHGVADIKPDTEYDGENPEEKTSEEKRPSQADSKADWLAFAQSKGLDVTDESTKAEIVEAVKNSEKENG
jgi:hypothetical protein